VYLLYSSFPGSCCCVRVLQAGWHHRSGSPPGPVASFFGAAILTVTHFSLFFFFFILTLPTPLRHSPALANSRRTFSNLFFCPLVLGTPPHLCAILFRSVLLSPCLLAVVGVPIFSGNKIPSATNHRECFALSANHGRASVSRKGDAGLISPRGRRGAFLTFAGALRPCHSLPGGGGRWRPCTSTPLPYAGAIHGGRM
jgi:hypothetical protein